MLLLAVNRGLAGFTTFAAGTSSKGLADPECLPQSCSIYGGLRGVLDYGVVGHALLENLRAALRWHFTSSPLPGAPYGQPGEAQAGEEGEEWDWGEGTRQEEEEASGLRQNVFLVETAALGPAAMWRHSGHLELFHDDVVQCTDTGSLFR